MTLREAASHHQDDTELKAELARKFIARGDVTTAAEYLTAETAGDDPELLLLVADIKLRGDGIADGMEIVKKLLEKDAGRREQIAQLGWSVGERHPDAGFQSERAQPLLHGRGNARQRGTGEFGDTRRQHQRSLTAEGQSDIDAEGDTGPMLVRRQQMASAQRRSRKLHAVGTFHVGNFRGPPDDRNDPASRPAAEIVAKEHRHPALNRYLSS